MTQPPGPGYGPPAQPWPPQSPMTQSPMQQPPMAQQQMPYGNPVPPPFGSANRRPRSSRWSLIAGVAIVAVWLVASLVVTVVRAVLENVHGSYVRDLSFMLMLVPAVVVAVGVAATADPAVRSRVPAILCAAAAFLAAIVQVGAWMYFYHSHFAMTQAELNRWTVSAAVVAPTLAVAGWILGRRRQPWLALLAVPVGFATYGVTRITFEIGSAPSTWIPLYLKFFALGDLLVMIAAVACCWLAVLIDRLVPSRD